MLIYLSNIKILTRQAFLEEILGNHQYIGEHALIVNINKLRKKENKNLKSNYIKTVYEIEYAWTGEIF
ncbi:hypothetical protein FT888_13060 [Clostridium perfringens]|nr:hypothetical protein [Clostridium perfringens]